MASTISRAKSNRILTIAAFSLLLLGGGLGLRVSGAASPPVQAEAAIEKLTVCYAVGIDAIGRGEVPAGIDTWNDCFTDDVVFSIYFAGSDFSGPPDYTSVGIASWASFADSFFRAANYTATQHLMGTVDVHVRGNKAKMSSYLQASHFLADGSVDVAKGTYEDEVVWEHGQWKIRRRTLKLLSSIHLEDASAP